MISIWWIWLAAALCLAILEMFISGFLFLGFAIGASAVGLILLVTGAALSSTALMLIFAVLSLISWLALRRVFGTHDASVKTFDHDIND